MSDSLRPHGLQHTSLPCPSPSPRVCPLMATESVMPSNLLVLYRLLLLLSSVFPSIRVFSNESSLCIKRPKCWSFSFSVSLSNEYSGLISFRIDWFWSSFCPMDSQEPSPAPQESSQEAGEVACYSPLFKNSPQFVVIGIDDGLQLFSKLCCEQMCYHPGLSCSIYRTQAFNQYQITGKHFR